MKWWWENKGKKEEMIDFGSLRHHITIINHVFTCIIITMISNFLMEMCL